MTVWLTYSCNLATLIPDAVFLKNASSVQSRFALESYFLDRNSGTLG